VDPLAWLGLKRRDEHPHLAAIRRVVKELLPNDEPVVHRYIVVVALLLTRVARADGVFLQCELNQLHRLFEHVERLAPDAIDTLCTALNEHAEDLDDDELELCFHELKALCDADERLQVMRLLAAIATADGKIAPSEHGALMEVAAALGVAEGDLAHLESEALQTTKLPLSVAPPTVQSDNARR
jgi:uncharacterized tellurite resistance protein B-like protein